MFNTFTDLNPIDISKYVTIINDWVQGKNIQQGLDIVYKDVNLINNRVLQLLSSQKPTEEEISEMRLIIILSNILYNNTSSDNLILEDGIYDLLIVKYKNVTGRDMIGAIPIKFPDTVKPVKTTKELVPGVTYLSEDEEDFIKNQMIYYDDIYYKNKILTPEDLLQPGVTYEKTVSKRLRDTSHNNPELVGTLDKCKFVLMKQAKDKGKDDDPRVKVLERDFFDKHIEAGIIHPNQIIDIIVELKYDGVSVEADIQNKRIISARTRGDTANDVASDLTPILGGYYLPNAPETNEIIGVKFEAIMTHENLYRYSQLKGREFANCRTAIISWIGSSDAYQYRELVTLVPLATNIKDEYGNPIDRLIEVEFMNRYLCRGELLRYSVLSGDLKTVLYQIYKFAQDAEFMRRILPFMYDGIVVSYLDPKIRKVLGRKDSVNQFSMAVKFNTLIRETRFVGYEYTIGQNGEITPMIYYNPVEFFGTIHPKSSGHSYGRFKELNLAPGDIIEVEYRHDVITYVTKKDCLENDNNLNPKVEFPKVCPFCGTPLEFTDSSARCPNFMCKERSIKRMANMMDKLQISGFGEETMRLLNVTTFHELMKLRLEDISYIGDLTSKSLIEQLDKLRNSNIMDYKLIGALGFSDLAANTWKLIFSVLKLSEVYNEIVYPIPAGYSNFVDILERIKGIGKSTIDTLFNEFKYFQKDIEYILKNIKYQDSKDIKLTKVRFTGVRNKELVDALNSMGYDAGEGSVTKDTDILIVPYEGYSEGNKYRKALDYGVTIKPIQAFINELGLDIN